MKKAFTIMELVIVGIIIITIIITTPLIKTNYKKHELYSQFRNSLTFINLALNMSVIENGEVNKWDLFKGDSEKILNTYFKPYLKDSIEINCQPFELKKAQSLGGLKKMGICSLYGKSSDSDKSLLKIGNATFGLYDVDTKKKQVTVTLDVNGFNAPNIIGRDIFIFKINDSIYIPSVDAGILNQNCSLDLLPRTGIIQGFGCADRLMNEGMMDY